MLITMLEILNLFCWTGHITQVPLISKWIDFFLKKKIFLKILGPSFYSKLDWGFYIFPTVKTTSERTGALTSMKFLSSKVVLYLFKSTIRPYIEYCCHV